MIAFKKEESATDLKYSSKADRPSTFIQGRGVTLELQEVFSYKYHLSF